MKFDFSLLMSTYANDNYSYLKIALSSIASQTLLPTETVLVIDGMIPDENYILLEKYKHILNIKFIQLKKNVGLGKALNVGLANCSYKWVARFDTDDINISNRFETQMFYLKKTSADIVGTLADVIDEQGRTTGKLNVPENDSDIKRLIWSCPIIHPSVMFNKQKIIDIGSYHDTTHRQEDYDLWIRSAFNGLIFYNIQKSLVMYRKTPEYQGKNSLSVGYNRFKIGFSAWWCFDRRVSSIVALSYPLFRPLLPSKINRLIESNFNPRK
ncbi:glycosyltransferase [Vibrio sp. 1CM2L]|uniref:glycosyltransferase n=1 Tax=Vibrio sp. 1CM2L TaxID=2929166 RepID=UPI0020BDF4AB|nr:glycosyltransferase [Vibrio sp. 1CM2L]MCK8078692.1 glycosyltransferase [Vibrio sp. 1CM2L]